MKPGDALRDPRDAVIGLDAGDAVRPEAYGRRAADLARLTALGLPVPPGVALSFACTAALADGGPMPVVPLPPPGRLFCARAPASAAGAGRARS